MRPHCAGMGSGRSAKIGEECIKAEDEPYRTAGSQLL